jgi:hypothetical protein
MSASAIAKALGVTDKTVTKAVKMAPSGTRNRCSNATEPGV